MEGEKEKIEVKLRKRTAAAASSFAQAWGFYTSHTHIQYTVEPEQEEGWAC